MRPLDDQDPSALKWLAEKRARVAHDAEHASRMVQELTERHQKLLAQLAALDETIRVYDHAIDTSAIAPVDGQPAAATPQTAVLSNSSWWTRT